MKLPVTHNSSKVITRLLSDIADVGALLQLNHAALHTVTHYHSECCVWWGLDFDCWWPYCVSLFVQLFALMTLSCCKPTTWAFFCVWNTWKSVHPVFGRLVRFSVRGCSFVRLQYFLILYTLTTCRVCTWRCRSNQLNNNIWRNLVRIQKYSTHFHSTITFSKCVCSLIKSNNSHYIKYMKVGETMTL